MYGSRRFLRTYFRKKKKALGPFFFALFVWVLRARNNGACTNTAARVEQRPTNLCHKSGARRCSGAVSPSKSARPIDYVRAADNMEAPPLGTKRVALSRWTASTFFRHGPAECANKSPKVFLTSYNKAIGFHRHPTERKAA